MMIFNYNGLEMISSEMIMLHMKKSRMLEFSKHAGFDNGNGITIFESKTTNNELFHAILEILFPIFIPFMGKVFYCFLQCLNQIFAQLF